MWENYFLLFDKCVVQKYGFLISDNFILFCITYVKYIFICIIGNL